MRLLAFAFLLVTACAPAVTPSASTMTPQGVAPLNEDGMTFGHVHVNVSSIAQHREIWTRHFGAEFFQKGPLTVAKFPSMLVIFNEREPMGTSEETVMDHLGFKVRDIEPMIEAWEADGLEVQSVFTGAEGFTNAYFMTPDGVRIELQEDPQQVEAVAGYHVHWFTEGHEDLLDWYIANLGVDRFQRGTIATTANAPGMNLSFNGSRTERAPSRGYAIDHIGFEYADLDAAVARLEARGITMDSPVRYIESIGLKIAFFTDPSGVYVELTEGLVDY